MARLPAAFNPGQPRRAQKASFKKGSRASAILR
jgi:hypothetical protein